MIIRTPYSVLALFATLLLPSATGAQAADWWSHVRFLASDEMRGRETGSPEHLRAANYIAGMFKRAGLRPGGERGYLQPVRFTARRIDEGSSSVVLIRNGVEDTLRLGEDVTINIRAANAPFAEGPLVFAGYGLSIPAKGYDDLAGLDVRGKVVVVMAGGPRGISGPVLSHSQSTRWANLRKLGAVGVIGVAMRAGDIPWSRSSLARLNPQMTLSDTTLDETAGQLLSATMNPLMGEKLFRGSGHTVGELLDSAEKGAVLPHFELPARVRSRIATKTWTVESQNVVGILPGVRKRGSPDVSDEYVVLSAHLDHLGVGAPVNGDSIFNGAMDNASGVATLIELARQAGRSKARNARSVIFLAVTGEEKGLLGSKYFANHPTVPAGSIVADINTDMFLPLFPVRSLIVNGLEESDLAADVRRAAARAGVEVLTDPEPARNAFIRSDQYSFIRRGIPSISLKNGFVRDSPEHEIVKRFRAERYHGVSDDVAQRVDLKAAHDFNRVYSQIVREIANRPTRPKWNDDSFFRTMRPGAN